LNDYSWKGAKMAAYNDRAIEISSHEFEETVNNGTPLAVVDFYGEWCMPCLMMAPVLEDLAEKFTKVKFAKVNIDENSELASRFKVCSIPCLIVFKDGKEVDRIVGALPEEIIAEKISIHMK